MITLKLKKYKKHDIEELYSVLRDAYNMAWDLKYVRTAKDLDYALSFLENTLNDYYQEKEEK